MGEEKGKQSSIQGRYVSILISILVLVGLYLTSLHNYPLFHSIAELFSIIVACGIFMIAWNSRGFLENNYLLFIGIAYLFVGSLDLIHTLAYEGMGVFRGYGTNLPTQLWIAGRYIESISLLIAPLLIGRNLRGKPVLVGYTATISLLLISIFYWRIFPDSFIAGVGLTPFKIISEYIISLILLTSLALLIKKRRVFNAGVLRLLSASIIITIASELSFTLYIDSYGLANLIGHFLKIASFYLIYKAIIETGLVNPYSLLFRELKKSEEALRESEERLRSVVQTATDAIVSADSHGKIIFWNRSAEVIFGYSAGEVVNKPLALIMPERFREAHQSGIDRVVSTGKSNVIGKTFEVTGLRKDGSEFPLELSLASWKTREGIFFTGIVRDITERRRTEEEREQLANRIRLLLESTDEGIYGIDPDGYCTFINRAAADMVRYKPEEVMGSNMHELIHHRHSDGSPYPADECPILHAFRVGQGVRLASEVFWRKDGTSFPIEYSSHPIIEEGVIKGAVVTFTDITERKRAEQLGDALNEIKSTISSTLDFDRIMQGVTIESAKAIGCDTAAVTLREGDSWVARYAYGFPQEFIGMQFTNREAPLMDLAARIKRPVAVNDAYNDERTDREVMERYGILSTLAIPLMIRGDVIGVLFFNYRSAPITFTEAQVDFAGNLGMSISFALENARLYEAKRNIADTLQSAILKVPKEIPGLDFGYLYRSATEVARIGGDLYDFFELENGKVGFVIGDVSGKGLEAAAITSIVKSTIRAFAYRDCNPSYVLAEANSAIAKQVEGGQFITAIYGTIDTASGSVVMASAGHPDPFICDPEGCIQKIARRNPPLGIFPGTDFASFEARLNPGDTIVLYTDGLIEAKYNGELFGDERVQEVLDLINLEPTKEIVDTLLSSAQEYSKNKLSDDIAIVALRYVGAPERCLEAYDNMPD
ncbi:MAG: SpoIIE family protein phosphatase [Actinobacteria bacterium]|nr:SpoIIE family protein phosphatase [Actinomycetota bacterium]